MFIMAGCSHQPAVVHDGLPSDHATFRQNRSEPVPHSESKSRYGNKSPYEVLGKRYYVVARSDGYKQKGIASWYGTKFHDRLTSSREPYDMYAFTAAHKTLPIPSYVEVTNLENNKKVVVRVNDRGPFKAGRIIDLSYAAARKLEMIGKGTARVEIEVVSSPTRSHTGSRPGAGSGKLFVQLGAFSSHSNAQVLADQVRQLNFGENVIINTVQTDQGRVYRVRMGPFNKAKKVDRLVDKLLSHGFDHPNVVIENE